MGPAGTQALPARAGLGQRHPEASRRDRPGGQGITAGQFHELVDAIRRGATYANVHSTLYPGGEIRAQLEEDDDRGHDRDDD